MEYSNRFNKLIQLILKREGGYCDRPADSGKATNRGVTQKVYDEFRLHKTQSIQSVKYITVEEALEIYYKEYYCPLFLDSLKLDSSADILFDLAVNSGVGRAKKFEKQYGYDPKLLLTARYNYYISLCNRKPSQLQFLKGWISRLNQIAIKYNIDWKGY